MEFGLKIMVVGRKFIYKSIRNMLLRVKKARRKTTSPKSVCNNKDIVVIKFYLLNILDLEN
jgi:hypothetical protein